MGSTSFLGLCYEYVVMYDLAGYPGHKGTYSSVLNSIFGKSSGNYFSVQV